MKRKRNERKNRSFSSIEILCIGILFIVALLFIKIFFAPARSTQNKFSTKIFLTDTPILKDNPTVKDVGTHTFVKVGTQLVTPTPQPHFVGKSTATLSQTYTSNDGKLSFLYPSTWHLQTGPSYNVQGENDIQLSGNEGSVSMYWFNVGGGACGSRLPSELNLTFQHGLICHTQYNNQDGWGIDKTISKSPELGITIDAHSYESPSNGIDQIVVKILNSIQIH